MGKEQLMGGSILRQWLSEPEPEGRERRSHMDIWGKSILEREHQVQTFRGRNVPRPLMGVAWRATKVGDRDEFKKLMNGSLQEDGSGHIHV